MTDEHQAVYTQIQDLAGWLVTEAMAAAIQRHEDVGAPPFQVGAFLRAWNCWLCDHGKRAQIIAITDGGSGWDHPVVGWSMAVEGERGFVFGGGAAPEWPHDRAATPG